MWSEFSYGDSLKCIREYISLVDSKNFFSNTSKTPRISPKSFTRTSCTSKFSVKTDKLWFFESVRWFCSNDLTYRKVTVQITPKNYDKVFAEKLKQTFESGML